VDSLNNISCAVCASSIAQVLGRVADPKQAESFAREYESLQHEFLAQRMQLGRDYTAKLIELWQRISTASQSRSA